MGAQSKVEERTFAEEAWVGDIQYELSRYMKYWRLSREELSKRMGVPVSHVNRAFSGDLTLRFVGRAFWVMGTRATLLIEDDEMDELYGERG